MDYIVAVLRKCKQYGFRVYMDPHQDIVGAEIATLLDSHGTNEVHGLQIFFSSQFSRFTGGSGAPYWVLPACGIDHRGFAATQAAFLHSEWPSPAHPDPADFPDMLWATNYTRLAPATLSVLFFAGHDYAPRCKIDGKPISEWLQDHFMSACRELAVRIRDAGDLFEDCVIGWDSLNEPNGTYIGIEDFSVLPKKWQLRQGPMPSPLQSMLLGTGQKQTMQNWVFSSLGPKSAGDITVDPKGDTIWMSEEDDAKRGGSKWGWKRDPDWPLGQCVWAAHGIWDPKTGQALKPGYFKSYRGERPVDFVEDYWLPFWRKYAATIRPIHHEAIMFIQPPVFEPPPKDLSEQDLASRACVSCHFYDGLTLITKHWNWFNADAVGLLRGKYAALVFALRFGEKAIRKVMRDQLGYLRGDTLDVLGKYPTIIGELGIPFDLDKKRSYYGDAKGTGIGDYRDQTKALDASLNACDGTNLLNYTLWTYCPDNTHKWGDQWNGEDLSVWSLDDRQQTDEALSSSPSSRADTLVNPSQVSLKADTSPKDANNGSFGNLGGLLESTPQSLAALFNGSRSSPAFWRPYPMTVVGDPKSIDFDIKSSTFHLVCGPSSEPNASDAKKSNLPTEIFVPLCHYAEDEELARALSGDADAIKAVIGRPRDAHTGTTSSSSASAATHATEVSGGGKTAANDGTGVDFDDIIEDRSLPALALDVKVSSGRYEVRGQVLRWWADDNDQGDEIRGDKRREITIRRRGGAVKSAMVSEDSGLVQSCLRGCVVA